LKLGKLTIKTELEILTCEQRPQLNRIVFVKLEN
jgi:hypothetical protein